MLQQRYDRFLEQFENTGNSISFYLLLLVVGMGIWILTPLAPDWRPDGKTFAHVSIIFAGITILHGLLWIAIVQEQVKLPKKIRAAIATTIRFLRPLHTMTGILALGVVLIHGYAYINAAAGGNIAVITGVISLFTLVLLAIDGIGLLANPLLNRLVHRIVAATFVLTLIIHLLAV